ncbi:MAG: hypothetical protein ACNA8H_07220 [Anaerolineales bacterium]
MIRPLISRLITIPALIILISLTLTACYKEGNNPSSPNLNGFATFEGTIFVVTTGVTNNLWNDSGWDISDSPINTDQQTIPLDCTLYPHAEVNNQWIGGCTGKILVPHNGAEHISVMVSNQDGSMTVFQVAPQPSAALP